jgi:hypothetical protein
MSGLVLISFLVQNEYTGGCRKGNRPDGNDNGKSKQWRDFVLVSSAHFLPGEPPQTQNNYERKVSDCFRVIQGTMHWAI